MVPLIKKYLLAANLSVVYGPPNQGKTLLALLMGYCVATGRPFGEMRTHPGGLVVYVVLEGGGSVFTDRLLALRMQYPEDGQELFDRFIVLETTLDLRSPEKTGDAKQLLARIQALSEERRLPITMIIFDTLIQAIGGGDENSSQDMNPVYQNASAFKDKLGAHVMFVAHSGKDEKRGIRGWSGQGAHIDSLFFVDNGVITY